jgi:hypothetical protein
LRSVVLLFSLLSARSSSRNRLLPILILIGDDIRLQLRPLDFAVVGNRAFTLIARHARRRNCACGLLPNATGWILSSFFFPLFLLRLSNSHLQISRAEAIRIVCDSPAPASPQTQPTNEKLHAQVGPFYQFSQLFSGSTRLNHSKITC